LELLVDLPVIGHKVEYRVKQLGRQQLQKGRKSSLSKDRHGGIGTKKSKREMKKEGEIEGKEWRW
ncbi:hypothetical protein Gotur_028063, partial [Gossypium turneri]